MEVDLSAWPDVSCPTVAEVVAVAEFRESLRRFQKSSERIVRRAGLTPQRYQLLMMIKGARDGSERSTVGELAERLYLAQSTVTELVQRAEECGLIERDRMDRETRVVKLRLTGEGEKRFGRAFHDLGAERQQVSSAIAHLTA